MASNFADVSCSEDIDEIKKLHNSNNQLRKTNNQLYQELETLRSHYREVLEKNKNFEEQNNECDNLKEKIQSLENEKNDLAQQLKTTQNLVDDLKEKQTQEKENSNLTQKESSEPINSDISDNNSQNNQNINNSTVQSTNDESEFEIPKLIEDNKILSQSLKDQIKKNEQFKQKNKNLLETFSYYFQRKFQNITQLITFVKKEGKSSSRKPEQNVQQVKPKKIDQKKSDNLESYNKKLESQKLNLEMELKQLENDVIKYKHEVEINDIKYNQEIEGKNKKISTLENENSFLKQQIIEMNNTMKSISPSFHLPNNSEKDKDKDNAVTLLQQTLSETTKQLQNTQNENKDISRQLSNAKADNKELYNKIEDKNQEIINLRIERDDYEGKYNAVFAQIEIEKANNQRLSSSLNDIFKKYQISQSSISNFAKLFDSQKEEISKLTNDRNTLSTLIFKIIDFIQNEEDVYKKLISENKSYIKNLKSIKSAINKIKNQSSSDREINSIPITSWYCLEFDEDLCHKISEIASNEGISDTSKLKYVFQTIAKHYKNKVDDLTNENKKELEKNASQTTTTTDFITSIAKQVGVQDFDSNSIKNPLKVCEFQQNLSSLINECENLRKSFDYHTNLLNNIAEKVNSTYDEIPNKIDSTNKLVTDLQKDKNNSLNKQKADKQEYRKKLEQLNLKNSKSNEQKDSQIAKLKSQNARLSSQIKTLNKIINENKIIENQTELSQIDTDFSATNNQIINSINNQIKNNNNNIDNNTVCNSQITTEELSSQINEQNNLIKIKDKEIQRLEDEVNFWKQNLEVVKVMQDKKEVDHQKNKDNQDEILMSTRKKFQTEKDEIIKQYEAVISNIKKQNLELKKVIENMSSSNAKNEEKISKLKDKNCQLNKENDQLTSQLAFQKDEIIRQNSINSQKLKACQLASESNTKNQLEDLQLQFFTEKKKLLSYAIHLFRNYYNNEKKIDENVYKDTLMKASDDLQKLSKQDKAVRELLGITDNESIEINLSAILMKLYNQK